MHRLVQCWVSKYLPAPPASWGNMLDCWGHEGRGHGGCLLCRRLKEGNQFQSSFSKLSYKIRHRFTCKSRFVCYLVTCDICGKQYVGSTTQHMHVRHVGHGVEVREESTPLGRHFAQCGMSNMKIQIIDGINEAREDREEALRCLEGVWQHRLAVFKQHGNINHRDKMEVVRRQNQPVSAFIRGVFGI